MLSDDEVKAICIAEIDNSAGGNDGDLSVEREAALSRYMGEPYGDEVDGRSQITTREIMETVEWIMPSLMRIFTDVDNIVSFDAVGPEDEDLAEQESDACSHIFWKQNRGFFNAYTFCKDALLSKTGILKIYYEDYGSEEREEYTGLDEQGFGQLLQDPQVTRQLLEVKMNDDGTVDAVFSAKEHGKICIVPVAPEHFGISRNANSPYVRDAKMCWDRTQTTPSNLIEAGYDRDLVESIPASNGPQRRESLARRNTTDERNADADPHPSLRSVWLVHCYIYLDRNEDGIAELLKVCLGSGDENGAGTVLLSVDEVDAMEHATAPPNILTHKFYGMSIADMLLDLQRIKTSLTRNYLDNIYLANNGRTAVNDEYVNVDDLLVSRPGGVVRFQGEGQWNQYIGPIPHNPLPPETMQFMEYIDDQRKRRTGAGEEVAALDENSLASINPAVAAIAFDASRSKIELIARILAEIGFRTVFERIHELASKNIDRALQMKLRDRWQTVNPSEWRSRTSLTINVGIGQASKERRAMALKEIMAIQQADLQGGAMGSLMDPQHLYQARADYTKAWGLRADRYWMDPRTAPPKQPPGPSPEQQAQMLLAQAAMVDAQAKQEGNKVQLYKIEGEKEISAAQVHAKILEAASRTELEHLKAEQTRIKGNIEAAGKVSDIQLEHERAAVETRIASITQYLDHIKAERDRDVDTYKIQMDAMTKLMTAQQKGAGAEGQGGTTAPQEPALLQQLFASVVDMGAKLDRMDQESKLPKKIERDANGLITSIGGKSIRRDASGRATGVG